MKRKIISLAICVACLLTVLASCGSNAACEAHTDADKNSVCDACGIPVVTIIEKVPTEEEIVEMIVAAIPEGATLGDVYNVTADVDAPIGELVANENLNVSGSDRYVAYVYDTVTDEGEYTKENWPAEDAWTDTENEWTADGYLKDNKYKRTYAVYDLLENKNVISYTTKEYTYKWLNLGSAIDRAEVELVDNFFFKATTTVYTAEGEEGNKHWVSDSTDAYYFLNGTKFVDEADVEEDDDFYAPHYLYNNNQGIAYVRVDETVYAIDDETYAVVASGHQSTMIPRPRFNYMTDAYGLVVNYDEIYFYDLTKWIECVYSYEIPAGAQYFILNNGNILVQELVTLPENAANYDYTDGIYKYDLVHTVVDVANKTASNLELGYYVTDVATAEYMADGVKDTVKNQLTVNVINNKNLGKTLKLACDDALAIIAEYDAVLPDFVSDVELVADGVFKGVVVYGEGSAVTKLFNAKGEELATLPNGAALTGSWIKNDGKYYDFTMKLLLDPAVAEKEEDRFTVRFEGNGFILLTKGVDTYYWNAALAAPVCVADVTNVEMVPSETDPAVLVPTTPNPVVEQVMGTVENDYFVVRTTTTTTTPAQTEGEPDDVDVKTVYTLYNAANAKVMESENPIAVQSFDIEGETVWVAMSDGVSYFAK